MSFSHKPYSQACDENGPHILKVLRHLLPEPGELLEIGTGTGQHAVLFAGSLPQLTWHTSDLKPMHDGINLWIDDYPLSNIRRPIKLDVEAADWPGRCFDAVFTANTLHIMSETAVAALFAGVSDLLTPAARFLIYGPFKYDNQHTSESNRRFDAWLRSVDATQGVRDLVWLRQLADQHGMQLEQDVAMPANNRILVWRTTPDACVTP